MENNTIPITVLMAVYNERFEYLKKSIESILDQNFSNFEFLIINDGSTKKECLKILNEYVQKDNRIKIINNERNLGLTKSLNEGLRMAKGKYIARIDSDDIAEKNRLKKQLEFMEENPNYAFCGSWSYIIDKNSNTIGKKRFSTSYKEIKKKILFFNFFTHSSLFFRKDIILENGGYNEKIKKAQDYDLILKISAKYPVANIPEFLCYNREHTNSISSKGKKKQEWYGLISRTRAIFKYGYPIWELWKIIPAVFYFILIPYFLEKKLFNFLYKLR